MLKTKELDVVRTAEFVSRDKLFSYIIVVRKDITTVYVKDENDKETILVEFLSGNDIDICEEIVRLRQLKNEEDNEQ